MLNQLQMCGVTTHMLCGNDMGGMSRIMGITQMVHMGANSARVLAQVCSTYSIVRWSMSSADQEEALNCNGGRK